MRVIMLVQFPIEPFNTATRNGTLGAKMKQILDAIKPEAAYFTERKAIAAVSLSSMSKTLRTSKICRTLVSQLQCGS